MGVHSSGYSGGKLRGNLASQPINLEIGKRTVTAPGFKVIRRRLRDREDLLLAPPQSPADGPLRSPRGDGRSLHQTGDDRCLVEAPGGENELKMRRDF